MEASAADIASIMQATGATLMNSFITPKKFAAVNGQNPLMAPTTQDPELCAKGLTLLLQGGERNVTNEHGLLDRHTLSTVAPDSGGSLLIPTPKNLQMTADWGSTPDVVTNLITNMSETKEASSPLLIMHGEQQQPNFNMFAQQPPPEYPPPTPNNNYHGVVQGTMDWSLLMQQQDFAALNNAFCFPSPGKPDFLDQPQMTNEEITAFELKGLDYYNTREAERSGHHHQVGEQPQQLPVLTATPQQYHHASSNNMFQSPEQQFANTTTTTTTTTMLQQQQLMSSPTMVQQQQQSHHHQLYSSGNHLVVNNNNHHQLMNNNNTAPDSQCASPLMLPTSPLLPQQNNGGVNQQQMFPNVDANFVAGLLGSNLFTPEILNALAAQIVNLQALQQVDASNNMIDNCCTSSTTEGLMQQATNTTMYNNNNNSITNHMNNSPEQQHDVGALYHQSYNNDVNNNNNSNDTTATSSTSYHHLYHDQQASMYATAVSSPGDNAMNDETSTTGDYYNNTSQQHNNYNGGSSSYNNRKSSSVGSYNSSQQHSYNKSSYYQKNRHHYNSKDSSASNSTTTSYNHRRQRQWYNNNNTTHYNDDEEDHVDSYEAQRVPVMGKYSPVESEAWEKVQPRLERCFDEGLLTVENVKSLIQELMQRMNKHNAAACHVVFLQVKEVVGFCQHVEKGHARRTFVVSAPVHLTLLVRCFETYLEALGGYEYLTEAESKYISMIYELYKNLQIKNSHATSAMLKAWGLVGNVKQCLIFISNFRVLERSESNIKWAFLVYQAALDSALKLQDKDFERQIREYVYADKIKGVDEFHCRSLKINPSLHPQESHPHLYY